MEHNHCLYQKYRPQNLEDLKGNKKTKKVLSDLLDRDYEKIPKVFLLTGDPGTGKTTTAHILKRELEIADGFYEYNAGDERKLEDIRKIITELQYPSLDGSDKMYFFDECHQLTAASWEALNKPTENVPEGVFFVFATSEAGKVPKAIKTRATHLSFAALNDNEMYDYLIEVLEKENTDFSDDVLDEIVKISQGSSRMSLNILDKVIDSDLEEKELIELIREEEGGNTSTVKDICSILLKKEDHSAWEEVRSILKSQKMDPESTRRGILGYLNACLLGGAEKAAFLMECFEENYYDSGAAGLSLSCFKACFLGED
jgi:DNA polymerase-3 subunit gamma/tau